MEQNIGRNEGKVLSNKSPKLISVWGSFLNTLEKVLAENPQGVIFEILPSFFFWLFLMEATLEGTNLSGIPKNLLNKLL